MPTSLKIFLTALAIINTVIALASAVPGFLAVLVLVWTMNVVLLMGVKIDAEMLRAKELQAGMDSRRCIQAPPRSSRGAAGRLQMRRWTDRVADEILDG